MRACSALGSFLEERKLTLGRRLLLLRPLIENRPPPESWRDLSFVINGCAEVCHRIKSLFDIAREFVQTAKPFKLFGVAQLGGVECIAQNRKGLIVRLEWNREGVSVFAAVCEGEARRIGEAARCAMHNFSDQCERLKRPRAEPFDQQERRKVAEFLIVRHRQNGSKALQVDICATDFVMRRHH